MPEIAEVARIVHYLKKSLVGKTLANVKAPDDAVIFGKAGTTGAEFEKAMNGKKVVDAGQQGKYFWLIMSSPPHPVFHFGMTGWWHFRNEPSLHYRPDSGKEGGGDSKEEEPWPPKFWKFRLETSDSDGSPKVETAFSDPRRFSRVRLVQCKGEDIRKTSPLKENGPDPVLDADVLTAEWLEKKMKSKHVPIKALLLDQANISGIGNWVGDEILYNAKLHPEQYSDTFSSAQIKQLHDSIIYVTKTAVDVLGESDKFPDDWLFKHRWGKGKKGSPTSLPNGEKITFLTVGGRTSCVVPSIQKKTGAVAGDVKAGEAANGVEEREKKGKGKEAGGKKRKAVKEEDEDEDEQEDEPEVKDEPAATPAKGKGRSKKGKTVDEVKQEDAEEKEEVQANTKKRRISTKETEEKTPRKETPAKKNAKTKAEAPQDGRRRSGRLSGR
ncbi:formamidopyrimidine-DNA glycosylase [Xylogone sp. PMI_703]|nr:formamidopyrimidine-DNA glycosylase [Xylogone sp. PMI_703]